MARAQPYILVRAAYACLFATNTVPRSGMPVIRVES